MRTHPYLDPSETEAGLSGRDNAAPAVRAVRRTRVRQVLPCAAGQTGSFLNMAPEVVLSQPYDEKVDIFSLGCCLFEVQRASWPCLLPHYRPCRRNTAGVFSADVIACCPTIGPVAATPLACVQR